MFGAYTHCSWPKDVGTGPVADPSGRSFLFSLVNETDKPVRFSLRDKDGAIAVSSHGVQFGVNGMNFLLYHNGAAADCGGYDSGNYAIKISEGVNSYQPDDRNFEWHTNFLAGEMGFAAADIEVYEL